MWTMPRGAGGAIPRPLFYAQASTSWLVAAAAGWFLADAICVGWGAGRLLVFEAWAFSAMLIAAVLALLALAALHSAVGIPLVWVFNFWGSADLLYAFYQGNASGLAPGMLQATYFIPTFIVPLLLITHGLVFLILLRRDTVAAA